MPNCPKINKPDWFFPLRAIIGAVFVFLMLIAAISVVCSIVLLVVTFKIVDCTDCTLKWLDWTSEHMDEQFFPK